MRLLAELTYPEAEAAARGGAIALLPIGATEAHGPHLPLATDVILSEELARRTAKELEASGRSAVIAPSIAYSVAEYAAEFSGTVSIRATTAVALIADVCGALQRQGFARVCIVNSHLEPAHVTTVREACARVVTDGGSPVAFADQTERRWARTLSDEYKRGACHAGSYETSLVLAVRPEMVRALREGLPQRQIDLAQAMRAGVRTFREAGADRAYFGDPAAGSTAEGNDLYDRLTAIVLATIAEQWPG